MQSNVSSAAVDGGNNSGASIGVGAIVVFLALVGVVCAVAWSMSDQLAYQYQYQNPHQNQDQYGYGYGYNPVGYGYGLQGQQHQTSAGNIVSVQQTPDGNGVNTTVCDVNGQNCRTRTTYPLNRHITYYGGDDGRGVEIYHRGVRGHWVPSAYQGDYYPSRVRYSYSCGTSRSCSTGYSYGRTRWVDRGPIRRFIFRGCN